ncbi:MAG: hypothetical protein NTY48_06935, partial [Candidatus Diapherotrites archaeon]|nr:hypothetical protein [Candidatus Diapherotrites archaeon]
VAQINSSGIVYSLNLGSGIPYYTSLTQLDSNSTYKVKIPVFGKEYFVDEATATKLVLYQDTTPTDLAVGESIEVDGTGVYAGKKLSITLVDLTSAGTGSQTYKAKWSLKDGTTVLKYYEATPAYDLKDAFGTEYFQTSVYVSSAGQSVTLNKYTATIRTGTSRLEIRNGEVFPYISGVTNPQWKAYITGSGTGVNGSDGVIKYIQVKNNWSYLQTRTEQANSKFVLKAGGSIMLPDDYAKVQYNGWQDKSMAKATIGGDSVTITDSKGVLRTIPMVISLSQGTNTFQIDGKTYLMDVNTTDSAALANGANTGASGAARYWAKPLSTISGNPWDSAATGTNGTDRFDLGYTTKDVNTGTVVSFTVDTDWKSGAVKYFFGGDESTSQYWLFLAAQTFDLDSKSDTIMDELRFAGTEIDQNAANGVSFYGSANMDLNYYFPDVATYNVLTAERNPNVDVPMGTISDTNGTGSRTGVQQGKFPTPTEGDTLQYVSEWQFNSRSTATSATTDVNFWINNSSGTLVNLADNKTRATIANASAEVNYASWALDEYSSAVAAKLLSGITDYGTTVAVASGVATIMMPEEARKVTAYVGSSDTVTTTVGGQTFPGAKVGVKNVTTGGTEVTVTAISGATSGVSIVPVGEIVKLDTGYTNGKSIIVGGQLVNKMAQTVQVDGKALGERLITDGDYVAAVLEDGKIVVAGWTAADTKTAAQALIAALDAM